MNIIIGIQPLPVGKIVGKPSLLVDIIVGRLRYLVHYYLVMDII